MNELNKLIEQWGESKNSPWAASSFKSMVAYEYENGGSPWLDFIEFMLASRPTCGKEQRKFLDEVEKGSYVGSPSMDLNAIEIPLKKGMQFIHQSAFTADLQKVIKGE